MRFYFCSTGVFSHWFWTTFYSQFLHWVLLYDFCTFFMFLQFLHHFFFFSPPPLYSWCHWDHFYLNFFSNWFGVTSVSCVQCFFNFVCSTHSHPPPTCFLVIGFSSLNQATTLSPNSVPQRQGFPYIFLSFSDWAALLFNFLLSKRTVVVPPHHSMKFCSWLIPRTWGKDLD